MIKTNTQSRNVRFSATTAVTRVKKGGYKYNLGRQKWVSKATGRNSNEKKKSMSRAHHKERTPIASLSDTSTIPLTENSLHVVYKAFLRSSLLIFCLLIRHGKNKTKSKTKEIRFILHF
jgi:hypothetical protein